MPNEELKKHALRFLRAHTTAVLATSSLAGEPQAAALYFGVDDDFNFYFTSSAESLKIKNLLANKHASVVVGFGSAVSTIQGFGDVEVTTDVDYGFFSKIVEKIKLYEPDQLPTARASNVGYTTIKMKPRLLTWLNLDKVGYPETYSPNFQKII